MITTLKVAVGCRIGLPAGILVSGDAGRNGLSWPEAIGCGFNRSMQQIGQIVHTPYSAWQSVMA